MIFIPQGWCGRIKWTHEQAVLGLVWSCPYYLWQLTEHLPCARPYAGPGKQSTCCLSALPWSHLPKRDASSGWGEARDVSYCDGEGRSLQAWLGHRHFQKNPCACPGSMILIFTATFSSWLERVVFISVSQRVLLDITLTKWVDLNENIMWVTVVICILAKITKEALGADFIKYICQGHAAQNDGHWSCVAV